jgi:hypothetical protein
MKGPKADLAKIRRHTDSPSIRSMGRAPSRRDSFYAPRWLKVPVIIVVESGDRLDE